MYVMCAKKYSLPPQACQNISASILVKRHMSAMYVRRDLIILHTWRDILEPTLVKSHMYVMCATKDSLHPQTCQDIFASLLVKRHDCHVCEK